MEEMEFEGRSKSIGRRGHREDMWIALVYKIQLMT